MFSMLLTTDQEFCQLYQKYKKYAGTVCLNTMKRYYSRYFSFEEMKDILQEAFLSIYLYVNKTDVIYNMKSLIARITELKTITYMEKYVKYTNMKIPIQDEEDDPIEVIIEAEDLQELAKLIKTLHPKFSSVILLKNFHNISLTDIAEISGISYNTILSWHSRGKRLLAKRLDKKAEAVSNQ